MSAPQKRLSKSILSMYLRTKCDRELYLSLHTDKVLSSNNLPEPLTARPGIGILRDAGMDFEQIRNGKLITAFSPDISYAGKDSKTGKIKDGDLNDLLNQSSNLPRIVLQPKFEPSGFQYRVVSNLAVEAADRKIIPPISGLIPDVLIIRQVEIGDEEILPTGERRTLDVSTENRTAISIIDIKHTGEANPSYSAEIAMYAVMLANWLEERSLNSEYFVTVKSYLWTRSQQGASQFDALISSGGTPNKLDYLDALLADCEDANLRFYMPAVLRFFREDIPRVIKIGDKDWKNLEWHVDGKCSACDWLGHKKWANSADKAKIIANPDHYCVPNAELSNHLSRIAGITRGARKTLELHSIPDTPSVASSSGTEPVYKEHSLLKKERSKLPSRATALHSGSISIDNTAVLASLASKPHLQVCAAINFDASAGILTGLALSGRVQTFLTGQKAFHLRNLPVIVDQKDLSGEWRALEAFLTQLADYIETAENHLQSLGVTSGLTAQIAFWEHRQFEELCAAMGRHLPNVLNLANRKAKGLAWLFPSEELLEKDQGAISPCIVFIDDIVRRVVFTPTPHVITLFDTVEHYHFGSYAPVVRDPYYREFLTNGIPRERIYEIWSGEPTIQRGKVSVPRTTVISEYSNALTSQCKALDSIVIRLRQDFHGHLKANAPRLNISVPRVSSKVAFDAKMWIWWDELEFATNRLEAHARLALDIDTLESAYLAIKLTNRIRTLPNGHHEYDVSPDSAEAKLDDNKSFLAVGLCSEPGFPLEKAAWRIPTGSPTYPGDKSKLYQPLYSLLRAKLVSFDRAKLRAIIEFQDDGHLINYLESNGIISFQSGIFITEGKSSFNWAEKSKKILQSIKNPPIAYPDPLAAKAMAIDTSKAKVGTDPITPAATILWDAVTASKNQLISVDEASTIANIAAQVVGLNPSQKDAVYHAALNQLSIIWGPPGTGKTKTLIGFGHALVKNSCSNSAGNNILITGPTYKAVEEVIGRLIESLESDSSCICDIFVAYSRSRTINNFCSSASNLHVQGLHVDQYDAHWPDCQTSLQNPSRVTIIATTVHQAYKFSSFLTGNNVDEIFDCIIIDESSQVAVTLALSPLATMKSNCQLIIAGDHLQMPPIFALEPPVGSEYMVGSIQTYLLERFNHQITTLNLEINYRSSAQLVNYAKTLGYPSTLTAFYPHTKINLINSLPDMSSGYPINLPYSPDWSLVLDPDKSTVTLLHEDDLSSQSNVYEAEIIAGLVYCLRQSASKELDGRGSTTHSIVTNPEDFWAYSVGIVTPHRAQRALIVKELSRLFPKEADFISEAVDTVEKFQGGERHVIFVSFGVADIDVISGEEAFLMQLERTNVAISRAMAKCVVVMPSNLAGHIPEDKRALLTAHAIKGYVDEYCCKNKVITISKGGITRKGVIRWRG